MARIVGVIAEYNPFHAGHAYHLRKAQEASGADHVVVVMSTCFTQRGDPALLSPSDRVRMALSCGADAVFALPAVWTVRDAEHFALGGTAILSGLGCDALSFGSETQDISLMHAAASMLENPDAAFTAHVRSAMSTGIPYPAAAAQAAEACLPGAGPLLSSPNSTLAICYLRALLRMNANMEIVPILRETAYHATALGNALPSATALRGAILRGDWQSVQAAMPSEAYAVLQNAARCGRLHRSGALDTALLYRLRTMDADEFAALPDASEGIEYRLRKAASAACTREELLSQAKTRRYPYARLSRMATHALLGINNQLLNTLPMLDSAWLLGFRKESANLLNELSRRSKLQILSRSAELDLSEPWVCTEQRAHDLWALGAGLPAGMMRSQGVTVVE